MAAGPVRAWRVSAASASLVACCLATLELDLPALGAPFPAELAAVLGVLAAALTLVWPSGPVPEQRLMAAPGARQAVSMVALAAAWSAFAIHFRGAKLVSVPGFLIVLAAGTAAIVVAAVLLGGRAVLQISPVARVRAPVAAVAAAALVAAIPRWLDVWPAITWVSTPFVVLVLPGLAVGAVVLSRDADDASRLAWSPPLSICSIVLLLLWLDLIGVRATVRILATAPLIIAMAMVLGDWRWVGASSPGLKRRSFTTLPVQPVLAMAGAAALLWWGLTQGVLPMHDRGPRPAEETTDLVVTPTAGRVPIRLESAQAKSIAGRLVSVRVVIENRSPRPSSYWVGYSLSPPGSRDAWADRLYSTSPVHLGQISAGAVSVVELPSPPAEALAEGEYRLAVWLHSVHRERRVVVQDASMREPIRVAPLLSLTIDRPWPLGASIQQPPVRFVVRNNTGSRMDVGLAYSAVAPGPETGVPPGWRCALKSGEQKTVSLPPPGTSERERLFGLAYELTGAEWRLLSVSVWEVTPR